MPSDIIVVQRDLLKSKVFRQLNGTAKTVYFDFLMKCRVKGRTPKEGRKKVRDILNNGEIEYSYSEAEKREIHTTPFMKAIDNLIKYGFIDIEHPGSGGRKGDKTLYAISDRWEKWGTDAFRHTVRAKDTRKGRGFQPGNTFCRYSKSTTFPPEDFDPQVQSSVYKSTNQPLYKSTNESKARTLSIVQKNNRKKTTSLP